jgi:hypothetical protein
MPHDNNVIFNVILVLSDSCCVFLQENQQADMNLAPEYSPEYPVIFNIMLWFSIAFTFSLLAISCEY